MFKTNHIPLDCVLNTKCRWESSSFDENRLYIIWRITFLLLKLCKCVMTLFFCMTRMYKKFLSKLNWININFSVFTKWWNFIILCILVNIDEFINRRFSNIYWSFSSGFFLNDYFFHNLYSSRYLCSTRI